MTIFNWNYVFIAIATLVLFHSIKPKWRIRLLAGVSVFFVLFQKSAIPFLGFIFAIITLGLFLFGWLLARFVNNRKTEFGRKQALGLSIVISFLPLFTFRYIVGEFAVNRLLLMATEKGGSGFSTLIAPLGISYFTFRIVCYLVEVYRRSIKPIKPSEYLAYVAFFPTMLAGPIHRVTPYTEQLRAGRKINMQDITEGIVRIIQGLVKKLVFGAVFYQIAAPMLSLPAFGDGFFKELEKFSILQLWICFYANYFYIYLDFSGYSDIAIGTARLFGIRIIENFNYPIIATNIADFWQRFHISLTSWIRDYVYFPLGGSRVGVIRGAFNTILMMILVGIWHGAAKHYAVFGIYMGTCLVIFRFWKRWKTKRFPDREPTWWGKGIGWVLTQSCYVLGLVIFSFTTAQALYIYKRMFGF